MFRVVSRSLFHTAAKTAPLAARHLRAPVSWSAKTAPKFASLASAAAVVSAVAVSTCETEPSTGIFFPPKLKGRTFVGGGPRIKFVFVKVYAVGIYVEAKDAKALKGALPETILSELNSVTTPKTVRIVMARDLSAEKYTSAIVEALEPRMDDKEVIEQFKSLNPPGPMKKGTEIIMELNGDVLFYSINGKSIGSIQSDQLTSALGDIYLGENCVSPPVREAICQRIAAGV